MALSQFIDHGVELVGFPWLATYAPQDHDTLVVTVHHDTGDFQHDAEFFYDEQAEVNWDAAEALARQILTDDYGLELGEATSHPGFRVTGAEPLRQARDLAANWIVECTNDRTPSHD